MFLAFSDSPYNWAGGVETDDRARRPDGRQRVMSYTHACQVFANDASR